MQVLMHTPSLFIFVFPALNLADCLSLPFLTASISTKAFTYQSKDQTRPAAATRTSKSQRYSYHVLLYDPVSSIPASSRIA